MNNAPNPKSAFSYQNIEGSREIAISGGAINDYLLATRKLSEPATMCDFSPLSLQYRSNSIIFTIW